MPATELPMQTEMLAAYRDDSPSILTSLLSSFVLTNAWGRFFPPRDFVGRGSLSFRVTDLQLAKLKSIQMRPVAGTHDAPLWRLTCEWEIPRQALLPLSYGPR